MTCAQMITITDYHITTKQINTQFKLHACYMWVQVLGDNLTAIRIRNHVS